MSFCNELISFVQQEDSEILASCDCWPSNNHEARVPYPKRMTVRSGDGENNKTAFEVDALQSSQDH